MNVLGTCEYVFVEGRQKENVLRQHISWRGESVLLTLEKENSNRFYLDKKTYEKSWSILNISTHNRFEKWMNKY